MATTPSTPSPTETDPQPSDVLPATRVVVRKTRKLEEVVQDLARLGHVFFVGEWRGYKPEEIRFSSRKDGSKQLMKMLRHNFEVGHDDLTESLSVSQGLEESFDLSKSAELIPFKKGTRVVVVVGQYIVDKGVRSARALEMHLISS